MSIVGRVKERYKTPSLIIVTSNPNPPETNYINLTGDSPNAPHEVIAQSP